VDLSGHFTAWKERKTEIMERKGRKEMDGRMEEKHPLPPPSLPQKYNSGNGLCVVLTSSP